MTTTETAKRKVITVHVGPYATVRAIEKAGFSHVTYSGIISETDNAYTYEIWGTPETEQHPSIYETQE